MPWGDSGGMTPSQTRPVKVKQFLPTTSLLPAWRHDGREISVMQCDKGYCTVDIWSAAVKR